MERQHDSHALVYFARFQVTGHWKIGVSYDAAARMMALVSQRKESGELVAAMPGEADAVRRTFRTPADDAPVADVFGCIPTLEVHRG